MIMGAWGLGRKSGWKNPYITDGLVAMWDGEWNAGGGVHDNSASGLADLVGNGPMVLYNSSFSVTDRSVRLVKNGMVANVSGLDDAYTAFTLSIELIVRSNSGDTSNDNNILFKVSSASGGAPRLQGPDSLTCARKFSIGGYNNAATGLDLSYANPFHIAVVVAKTGTGFNYRLYKNGDLVKTRDWNGGTNGNTGSLDNFIVGGSVLDMDFFGSRIYSRALTADEIAANYAIDKQRFNLP